MVEDVIVEEKEDEVVEEEGGVAEAKTHCLKKRKTWLKTREERGGGREVRERGFPSCEISSALHLFTLIQSFFHSITDQRSWLPVM